MLKKRLTSFFGKIRKLRRRYVILGVIALFAIGFFVSRANAKQTPLEFVQVERKDIRAEIAGSGTLTGKNSADLHFKSSGRLAYIQVKVGQQVNRGQLIAGLDTQELSINLREAENTLRDKRAIVDKIHDDLHDVTAESFTQRQTRTTAEVAQDNAYEGFLAAQRAFQDAVIVTPIGGVVTQAIALSGQTVTSSTLIAQVVDTSEVFFETDVDETDIGKVSVGLSADVMLDAYPDKVFTGSVDQILPQTKITSSGATVITVRIKLEIPAIVFINGLSGQAAIITAEAKNVLTVPIEAVREDDTVVVEKNKTLRSQKVTK